MKAFAGFFKDFFNKINHSYHVFLSDKQVKYRILKLDLPAQEITLYVRRKSLILKYAFSEVMNELWMIEGLSSNHACWFGLFFGMSFRASIDRKIILKKSRQLMFMLKNSSSRYKIVFQNRNGDIGYIDNKTKQEYVEHPMAIARNKYAIEKFNPTQACYIGILAGMDFEKIKHKDGKGDQSSVVDLLRKKTHLRIVN